MVLYSQRNTPLALNSANTAFSNNIRLAYDFTNHDAPRSAGVPWLYQGATIPTHVLTGTMPVSVVAGEPGAVAASGSLWQYNSTFANTVDYGLQVGTGDFTIGVRITTPSALPANANSREMFRINGSSGAALVCSLLANTNVGFYFSATGSTCCPLGATNGTPTYFPADTAVMVWIRKVAGITTIYTQNATTQANTVVRYVAGAAATTPMDSTWAASLRVNFASTNNITGIAMQAWTFWNVGHTATTLDALGKNFYDTQANVSVPDSIAITSPAAGGSIAASSVISGTYAGIAPTGVEVQHGAAAWVAGTGMVISNGTWSGSFLLTAAAANTLQARESNAPTVLSATVANVTVTANSITFTGGGATLDEAVPYRIFQRNGSNQASVRIKLSYTGAPTGFEYSYNNAVYAPLGGAPSGGVHDAVVTLSGPSQGPLSVRFTNDVGVVATMSSVGVSDGKMVAGQSNHVGGGSGTYVPPVVPTANPSWAASILDKTGTWRPNVETSVDPFSKTTNASNYPAASATYAAQASSAAASNSYFGALATKFMNGGLPIAFVPSAIGSTSVANWAVSAATTTLYGAMVARATAIGYKDVLWWQGEQDCTAGTTRSAYESALNAIINDWCVKFPGAKWVLMNINATGNAVGTGGTGPTDTGFNAIHAAINYVAATNANVTGYANMNGSFSGSQHYSTAPEITEISTRAYSAMTSTRVSTDLLGSYSIAQIVGENLAGNYGISALVSADFAASYSIGDTYTAVSADLSGGYGIYTAVSADLYGAYGISALVAADLAGAYAVAAASATVYADLVGSYGVLSLISSDLAGTYLIESNSTLASAPAGDGYRPRFGVKQLRPAQIQG